jgi:hypothetical protein
VSLLTLLRAAASEVHTTAGGTATALAGASGAASSARITAGTGRAVAGATGTAATTRTTTGTASALALATGATVSAHVTTGTARATATATAVSSGGAVGTMPVWVSTFTNTVSAATTITATIPTVTTGQLVLVRFATAQGGSDITVTGGTGWTVLQDTAPGVEVSTVLVGKVVDASDSATVLTATMDTGRSVAMGRVYSDGQLPTAMGVSLVAPTSTSFVSPAVTATANSLLTIWQIEQTDTAGGKPTFTPTTGATNNAVITQTNTAGSAIAIGVADLAAATAGSYGPYTATSTLTGLGYAATVAIPASSSAPEIHTTAGTGRATATATAAVSSARTVVGTARALAGATSSSTSTRTRSGSAVALATATGTRASSRVTTGTARALAAATGTTASTRTRNGSAVALATATAARSTTRTSTGTALALATATGTTNHPHVTAGTAVALAAATSSRATTRTTVGTARALAAASGVTVHSHPTAGTARATATATASQSGSHATVGTARAIATATGVTVQPEGAHVTVGTARATATATAARSTIRTVVGTARALAGATGITVHSHVTSGRATALATATSSRASTRTTVGTARAIATGTGVAKGIRPTTGTARATAAATSTTTSVHKPAVNNLFPNPSYEVANGWNSNNGAVQVVATDTTVYRSGTQSRRGHLAAGQTSGTILSLYGAGMNAGVMTPLTPGQTYTYSMYMRAGQAGYRGYVTLGLRDAAGVVHASQPPVVWHDLPAGVWTRVSLTHVIPAGATQAYAAAYVTTYTGNAVPVTDFANADDAMLTVGPVLHDYTPGDTYYPPARALAGASSTSYRPRITTGTARATATATATSRGVRLTVGLARAVASAAGVTVAPVRTVAGTASALAGATGIHDTSRFGFGGEAIALATATGVAYRLHRNVTVYKAEAIGRRYAESVSRDTAREAESVRTADGIQGRTGNAVLDNRYAEVLP